MRAWGIEDEDIGWVESERRAASTQKIFNFLTRLGLDATLIASFRTNE